MGKDYYPYTDLWDKVSAYKSDIASSLSLVAHPDQLDRVYKKLKKLDSFWRDGVNDMELDKRKSQAGGISKPSSNQSSKEG